MHKKKIQLILLAIWLFGLSSCGEMGRDGNYVPTLADEIRTYTIDSCEYVGYIQGRWSYLAHKGNCKYCAERRAKETKKVNGKELNTMIPCENI